MPELPEVETVVRGLRPHLEGRTLTDCLFASALMAETDGGTMPSRLNGRRVDRIDRQGKWIFGRLDSGDTLAVHLGMTGRLSVEAANRPVAPHTHLRVRLNKGNEELRFVDPRRFGELLLLSSESVEVRFGPDRLGGDAMNVTPRRLAAILAGTSRRIKAILLDQRQLAGIGNIYADEILFEAGLHPSRIAPELLEEDQKRLVKAILSVLKKAIRYGGSTIRDYVSSDGRPGSFQSRHRVYGQEGRPCKRCGSEIQLDRSIVTGRATHFCPCCQPAAGRHHLAAACRS